MIARWLLPIVAVLALLGQSVSAWAAAGLTGPVCCCPAPKECRCHDHDDRGDAPRPAELRRCSGDAQHVAPAPLVADTPAPPVVAREVAVARAVPPALPQLAPVLPARPEKPPS